MSAPPQSHRGPTSDHATWPLLERLRGVGPVFKGEPILMPAALDQVPRLDVFRERQYRVAVRTAHPIRESCQPLPSALPDAQGVARAVRTVEQVPGLASLGQRNLFPAVGASDRHRDWNPRRRLSRPRSKPPITSSSTVMTGTAKRPVLATSSSRAVASSATFFATKGTPWDERNSFAAWQDCQVDDQ